MSSLSVLYPEPSKIKLNGKTVKLHPVTLEHFELFGSATAGLIDMLSNAGIKQLTAYAKAHSKELDKLLAATTDLNRWQRRKLPATVAMQLVVAIVSENAGFFGEALPAMLENLSGAISSSASSEQGTR